MPKFSYVARDKDGKTYRNVAEAATQEELVTKIQSQNYFLVSIKEISQDNIPLAPKKDFSPTKKRTFSHKKVKLSDIMVFCRQLATMLDSGVTLIRSLSVIESQIQSEMFSDVLKQVKKDVEQGTNFSAALEKHPKVFNQFWVSLMEVGEASGTIPTVLNKLTFYIEQQAAFRSTILSGMIYPAILFLVAQGAIAFFALVVGPKFESIFKSMDVELPLLTVSLLALFKFIKTNIFYIFAAIGLSIFAFKKYVATYRGRLRWESFILGLPTVGDIYRMIIIERFTSQMAILIDAGVPILYALDIAERLVNNNTCALIINKIKQGVKEGQLLVGPMERSGFFPPMALQMILVGEETGELSKMLNHVASYYQNSVETFMKRFSTLVEPVMLIFMGAVIGIIVVAMFMPLFNLGQLGRSGMKGFLVLFL